MANCLVTVKACEDKVSVSRKGDFSSKMLYKTGEASEFLYNTPYGRFPVILDTQKIYNNLSVMGGRLEIFYSVTIRDEENSHSLVIDVKSNIQKEE